MPDPSKTAEAFYVTDWLPDGERILIVVAGDCTSPRSIESIRHLCLYKSETVITTQMNGTFDPQLVPEEHRPTAEFGVSDQLERALASIDATYSKAYENHVAMCGAPSNRVSDELDDKKLRALYMIGGFAKPLEEIYAHTTFSGLQAALGPVVKLPVIHDRRDDVFEFEVPS